MTGPFLVEAFRIAHGIEHVQRVRRRALQLAEAEGYPHHDRVEAAALLHDIGLSVVKKRGDHATAGAEMAADFLAENELFPPAAIDEIREAIVHHSRLDGKTPLIQILRDADILDLLGAVGIMRAFSAQHERPAYDPAHPRGETWGYSADDFTARFRAGQGVGSTAVDYLNFHLSCVDNLGTETARAWARPLAATLRAFIETLAAELP